MYIQKKDIELLCELFQSVGWTDNIYHLLSRAHKYGAVPLPVLLLPLGKFCIAVSVEIWVPFPCALNYWGAPSRAGPIIYLLCVVAACLVLRG